MVDLVGLHDEPSPRQGKGDCGMHGITRWMRMI